MKELNIYVHVPFCEKKCSYCSFVSVCKNPSEEERYFCALKNEIASFAGREECAKTIYIGGGTPSVVSAKYIGGILESIRRVFKIKTGAEISIECNPGSLTEAKLKEYLSFGINRISIGVQSLNDADLQSIGRTHGSIEAESAVIMAKRAGFKNINADFLIGLFGQSAAEITSGMKKLIEFGVTHISAYMLMVEEVTLLCRKVKNGEYTPLSDDESVAVYNEVMRGLKDLNFMRYEVSNFALLGFECRHNLNIWRGENYVGFGLAAHGYLNGVRYENFDNLGKYYEKNLKNSEKLSIYEQREEFIMLSLRLAEGLDLHKFKETFNENLLISKKKELEFLIKNKLVMVANGRINVLEFGVLNSIILRLV